MIERLAHRHMKFNKTADRPTGRGSYEVYRRYITKRNEGKTDERSRYRYVFAVNMHGKWVAHSPPYRYEHDCISDFVVWRDAHVSESRRQWEGMCKMIDGKGVMGELIKHLLGYEEAKLEYLPYTDTDNYAVKDIFYTT